MELLPYKTRLIKRFNQQKESLGVNWRMRLSKADPFFNTKVGSDYMARASSVAKDPQRISVDRLERVVLAMESLSGVNIPAEA